MGYLIDNPWSNALDRAKAAGLVLADVLVKRSLGVRPGVVSGRFVNCYARNDWILSYLFRATSGGGTVAGLRPIEGIPNLENVDVTDKIAGHLSYRAYMPIILDQLGFPVTAMYFDEAEVRHVITNETGLAKL